MLTPMQALLVQVEGRVLRFDVPKLIRIGRFIEADVVLSAGSVSRQHAEIRAVDDGWVLVDAGSQYGTFVDGARITERRITGEITVQCGPESTSTLVITPEQQASPDIVGPSAPPAAVPPVPPPYVPATPQAPQTTPLSPPPGMSGHGPTPEYAASGADERTRVVAPGVPPGHQGYPMSGPDLLIVADGREYRYRHPADIRIGRQAECDIVITDPSCSRMHGQVSAVPGGWVFRNLSREGSFVEGRRIEHQVFKERLVLRLGHPVAGPEVSLVPILTSQEEQRRFARKRRRKVLVRIGAIIAALLLVAGSITTAVLLSRDDDDGPTTNVENDDPTLAELTDDELDGAKAATVLLLAEAPGPDGDTVQFSGSGSILSADGLILTNAHVAQPTAEGLAEYYGDDGIGDPDYLLVALVNGMDDTPAEASYRARPVEVDGHRDVAVVQIYADADGATIDTETLDLPTMPIGDSDAVSSGDDVTVLGFPGISESARLSVTKGVISTFIDREDLGPRSEIDTDARIAPGNSGGAAIDNDARIIGIPSALFAPDGSPVVSGRIRPINFVMDIIEDAEQQSEPSGSAS
jgi:putative serine protease PepD